MEGKSKQHTLWLLAAVSAPLAHYSGCGWGDTLMAVLVTLPLTLIPKCWEGMSRMLALIQIIWLGAVAGILIQNSAVYWPSDQKWVVPMTLLVLAACTAKGSAPRIGAVLAFCIGLLALPVAVTGATCVEPEWLGWTGVSWPAAISLVLLFPALPAAGESRRIRRSIWTGLMAACLSLLVQGTISPQVAASVSDPFFQTVRTLGYLEPIAAAGMTLGWYAMAIYLFQSAVLIGKNGDISAEIAYVLPIGTAIAAMVLKWQLDIQKCLVLSVVLWVLMPFLIKIKKLKKDEKRC